MMIDLSIMRFEHKANPILIGEVVCRGNQVKEKEAMLVQQAIIDAYLFTSRYGAPSVKLLERSLSYEIKYQEVENPAVIKKQVIPFSSLKRRLDVLRNEIEQQKLGNVVHHYA